MFWAIPSPSVHNSIPKINKTLFIVLNLNFKLPEANISDRPTGLLEQMTFPLKQNGTIYDINS
ncbi:hypothetical protein CE91St1_19400 [Parabacteroides goldsteinii]|nr:hypothetical protein CE91St1_19400 [Parabacteroides goldsteinii]GKG78732.1 hypothetical protein CE91St2_19240 [Parabacteroides goldsteinii]